MAGPSGGHFVRARSKKSAKAFLAERARDPRIYPRPHRLGQWLSGLILLAALGGLIAYIVVVAVRG